MEDVLGIMVIVVCLRHSTRVSFVGLLDTSPFVSGLNARIVVFSFEGEEHLEAVDLTSHVGIIHT